MSALSGGDKLKNYLAEVAKKVQNPGTLKVGFLEDATYPDGTPVATVAASQEFGTATIPPRPFFRNMISENQAHWPDDIAKLLASNGMDAAAALQVMGQEIKEEIQDSIEKLTDPPLKPATIKRKGSSKPLIDTAHMRDSVDFVVE